MGSILADYLNRGFPVGVKIGLKFTNEVFTELIPRAFWAPIRVTRLTGLPNVGL